MGYRFAAEYNHAQERLYTCHFYAIFAGPRFVEIQKYCFLPWQRDVTTSLSIRKETCLPLVRLLRFSLNKFSVLKSLQTITAFRFLSNNVKYRIYELGAFCVMALRPVITSTALSCIVNTKKKRKQRAISSGFATPVTGFLCLRKGSHEKQF